MQKTRFTRIVSIIATLAALVSCTRLELKEPDLFFEGDGSPVDVTIQFNPENMGKRTRALLNSNQERSVEDIYILLFRLSSASDQNPSVVNKVENRYFTKNDFLEAIPEDGHPSTDATSDGVSSGAIKVVSVPSGTYWIAAVANVGYGDIDVRDLRSKLDAVKNWNDFMNVKIHLSSSANTNRTYLAMSGYYLSEDSHTEHTNPDLVHGTTPPDPVVIAKNGSLPGYIHLRRLDAKVHFTIKNGMVEGNQAGVPVATRFRIKNWQLVNLPDYASVIEESHDLCDTYGKTPVNVSGWTSISGTGDVMRQYDLDFYMLENRGMSKNPISLYKDRELEEKQALDSEGFTLNFDEAQYINAPDNAAALIIEAEFQQTMPGDAESNWQPYLRDVNARYLIHLGYCEGENDNALYTSASDKLRCKANDFNTRRNTSYHYTVTINGATEIVVEALREDVTNNGTEGTVIDVKGGETIDLDAHYGVFNVVFTREEIRRCEFVISSPVGLKYWSTVGKNPGEEGYPDPWTEDYQHIRIAYNPNGTAQLRANQPVTSLVSYSKTYDYDCPEGTRISQIDESEHTLIPVHKEKKQIQDVATNHIYPVYDILSFMKAYGEDYSSTNPNGWTEANKNEPLVFTMFINEFYYYYTDGEISKQEVYNDQGYVVNKETPRDYTMWVKFVNQMQGRSFMFLTEYFDSNDGDSHYLKCKLNVRQRSIETYFGEHILDGYSKDSPDLPAAMGIEQINEHTYKNLSAVYYNYDDGVSDNDGYNVTERNFLANGRNTWAFHADQEKVIGANDNHVFPTFETKTLQELNPSYNTNYSYKTYATDRRNYELAAIAANRNRDLNRDGLITGDEIRWFTPSSAQYVTFCVGAGALQTPLFDKSKFDPAGSYWRVWEIAYNYKQVYYNGIFHYLGSNRWYVSVEEGTSTGDAAWTGDGITGTGDGLNTQLSGEIRCARYLGVIGGDVSYENIQLPEPASFDQSNYVVNTTKYSTQMHRSATAGRIPPHNNLNIGNNGWNSISDYFQVSTQNSKPGMRIGSEQGVNAEDRLIQLLDDNWFCRDYEDPVFGGRGTWRTPNQVELALMYNYMPEGLLSFGTDATSVSEPNLLTCTYWYRNDELKAEGSRTFEGAISGSLTRHFLGGRRDSEGRKLSMLHAQNLYGNKYYTVRCVRDTDKDGNYRGNPEYGNPVDFQHIGAQSNYVTDFVNYRAEASMNRSEIAAISATIDGQPAQITWNGDVATATVNGAEVRSKTVKIAWTITELDGTQLNYTRPYDLPARYWMISRYSVDNRYATVNPDNNRTLIGPNESRDLDDVDAIYKWVITRDPAGKNPVNESNLSTGVTYYLFNAGTENYISGPTSGSQSYMVVGGTPMTMQLQARSGYDGWYVLRFNNSTNANSNGGVNNFGTWTGVDDGSTYKLTPVVMKGEMPLFFEFASDYAVSGSNYSVSVETNSDVVVGNVTIGGITATVTGSNGHYTATVSGPLSGTSFETVWNLRKGSDNYVRRHTYNRHIKYYVISSEKGPQHFAYANGSTNRTAADATPYTGAIEALDANHQWIFTTTKTAVGVEPVNADVLNSNDTFYLYNRGTGKYLTGPMNTTEYGYFTIGAAEDRMKVKVEPRSGRYSFLFPNAGISNHCACVYRKNGGSWVEDPAVFGVFQTGNRDRMQYRFNLYPIYE